MHTSDRSLKSCRYVNLCTYCSKYGIYIRKYFRLDAICIKSLHISSSHHILRRSTIMTEKTPLRDERRICYEARDAFFSCCDRNKIENPLHDVDMVARVCKTEGKKFEKNCISSWVQPTHSNIE
jgi:Cytochrome oxidase c subunit VIb